MNQILHNLSDREQRTIRRAVVFVAIYLVLFLGFRGWKLIEARRADFQKLVQDAQKLGREIQPYEDKVVLTKKLMENFRLDPAKLSKASVVADASAAIQKAATASGIQLGPIRESPARVAARELASMQLEGSGPVASVLAFLQRLETIGYPLVLDSVQVNADAAKPGNIKVNLIIVVLDFEQWKEGGKS